MYYVISSSDLLLVASIVSIIWCICSISNKKKNEKDLDWEEDTWYSKCKGENFKWGD